MLVSKKKNVYNNINMDRRVSSPFFAQGSHRQPAKKSRRRQRRRYCIVVWMLIYTLACVWSVAWRQGAAPSAAVVAAVVVKDQDETTTTTASASTASPAPLLLLTTADGHLYFLNAWTGEFQSSSKSGAPLVTRSVAKPHNHPTSSSSSSSSSQRKEEDDNDHKDVFRDDDEDSASAMIVIPGLDGKLYWHQPAGSSSDDENDGDEDGGHPSPPVLLDTDLSIPHLLEHPVRSCNSDGTNCGILSAVAHTTLFGIDSITGSLVWSSSSSSSTNAAASGDAGTNDADSGSGGSRGSGSTVVLQRKDYWIRHISTTTGKQLWNVTLGTYQALDFDSAAQDDDDEFELYDDDLEDDNNNDADGSKDDGNDDPWLSVPSTRRFQDKKETLAYLGQEQQRRRHRSRRRRKPDLPALFFSQGGRQLAAVDPLWAFGGGQPNRQQAKDESSENHDDDDDDDVQARRPKAEHDDTADMKKDARMHHRNVLWRIEAPHIVTSVFGIHQGRWKALTVLDEADIFPSSASSLNLVTLQLPSEPYNALQSHDDDYDLLYHGRQYGQYDPTDFTSAWMRREASRQQQAQWTQMVYDNQQQQNERQKHQRLLPGSAPPTPYAGNHHHHAARSSYCVATTDANGEYSYQCPSDGQSRPRQPLLLLPGSSSPPTAHSTIIHAEGLLLSWTLVGTFVLGVLVLAVAGRIWYKRRKQSWLLKVARVRNDIDNHHDQQQQQRHHAAARSNSVMLHRRTPGGQLLQRSTSVPDTYLLGSDSSNIKTRRLLRPWSAGGVSATTKRLHAMECDNCNEDDDDDDDDSIHSSPGAVHTVENAGQAPPLVPTNTSSEEGVAVMTATATATAQVVAIPNPTPPLPLVQHAGGIPLVRYSRYASEFVELKALGKGGFGSVFSCKNNLDGRDYAIKKVCIRGVTTDSAFQQRLQRVLREVKILAVLDHPSIVRYYTAWLELQENDIANESTSTTTPSTTTATLHNNNKASRCYSSSYLTSHGGGGDDDDDTESEWDRVGARSSPQGRLKYKSQNLLGADYHDEDDEDDDSLSYFQRPVMFPRDIPSEELGIVFENSSTGGEENDNDTSAEEQKHISSENGNKNESTTVSLPGSTLQPGSSRLSAETSNISMSAARSSHADGSQGPGAAADAMVSQRSTPPHANGIGMFSSSTSMAARGNGGSRGRSTNGTENVTSDVRPESSVGLGDKNHSQNDEATARAIPASFPPTPTVKHTLYIQMQLCSGHTISDYLANPEARRGSTSRGGEADIPAALRLFLQVAQAVHHVHEQGLIHRDLKPSNCFMLDSGIVKVGDFGLSRGSNDKNESSSNTTTGGPDATNNATKSGDEDDDHTAGIGTRLYASPEQTKGSNYDSSTDVYSLGIMLFELCYPMYTGMERNICLSKLREDGIFPSAFDQTVAKGFPTIPHLIKSMLSTTPADRPTAAAVAEHIQDVLGELTILSPLGHGDDAHDLIFLRVEVDHARDDVLQHTMNQIRVAALPGTVDIVQYGLSHAKNQKRNRRPGSDDTGSDGGSTTIMEFALRSTTAEGPDLVSKLRQRPGIRVARQVSSNTSTVAATTAVTLMASSQSGDDNS